MSAESEASIEISEDGENCAAWKDDGKVTKWKITLKINAQKVRLRLVLLREKVLSKTQRPCLHNREFWETHHYRRTPLAEQREGVFFYI